jgi:hypothetical protein
MSEVISNQSVALAGFNSNFVSQCESMGFNTIEEILATKPECLIYRKGFTFNWLGELVLYLDKHPIQQIPVDVIKIK